jgi:hypothetical protein
MPLVNGRYMELGPASQRERAAHRWRWLRTRASALLMYSPWNRCDEDAGAGHTIHREWSFWTVRPASGWRSWRWITPPTSATRTVRRDDRDNACEWAMKVLGI